VTGPDLARLRDAREHLRLAMAKIIATEMDADEQPERRGPSYRRKADREFIATAEATAMELGRVRDQLIAAQAERDQARRERDEYDRYGKGLNAKLGQAEQHAADLRERLEDVRKAIGA
jgi:uncharacterized coiled-coil DUF342 family protein